MATRDHRQELDRLVREEHRRLVASLVGYLGGQNLALAEDVAQEALLEAVTRWPWQGTPDNPAAWLHTVARRRAIDQLRRSGREIPLETETEPDLPDEEAETDNVYAARIPDPQLRLVFLCCHASLSEEDQLALTLKVVGGFTAAETAAVLLKPESTISQRLARAKRQLRSHEDALTAEPSRFDINRRLPTVLKVFYLAYCHGYAPRSGDSLIREDVCHWVLQMTRELADHPLTASGSTQALASLVCFQNSRLATRADQEGVPILLEDQDRGQWNHALIKEGLERMQEAKTGSLSRYHFEAGIASLHATAASWAETDWQAMLRLYEALYKETNAPVVGINAAIARAESGDLIGAMERLERLAEEPQLSEYAPYYIARAKLLKRLGHEEKGRQAAQKAQSCGVSVPVDRYLDNWQGI